jgi:hypothetical protein
MPNVATARISPAAPASAPEDPPLLPGEGILIRADGVVLGWQPRTVLIWWLPGVVFIALAYVQFRSLLVTVLLAVFCAALFAFYASDSEVRSTGSRKRYVLTDRRLLIGSVDLAAPWRSIELAGVGATHMEKGLMDRVVARLSGAATIVLELRDPGPKGQPRRVRIGPMRRPDAFREAIQSRLTTTAPPPD